jgi:hypothetical protein
MKSKYVAVIGLGCLVVGAVVSLCYAAYALVLKAALGALNVQVDFWGALAIIVIIAIIASFFRSAK